MKGASAGSVAIILCSLIATIAVAFVGLSVQPQGPTGEEARYLLFQKVTDTSMIEEFIDKFGGAQYPTYYTVWRAPLVVTTGEGEAVEVTTPAPKSYSETNVQVEGIDEADIVKTDGTYIYLTGNDILEGYLESKVYIVKAYPPTNISLVSTINLAGHIEGLYIYDDKLIALTAQHPYWILKVGGDVIPPYPIERAPVTTIYIYDIQDKEKPTLVKEVNVTGAYVTSRLKGGVLYVITQCMAREDIVEPLVKSGLWIPRNEDYVWSPAFIVTIATLNLDSLESETSSYVTPPIDKIYMSHDNLYIVSVKGRDVYRIMFEKGLEIVRPMLPDDVIEELNAAKSIYDKAQIIGEWFNELPLEQKLLISRTLIEELNETLIEETYIYRFDLDGIHDGEAAIGIVPGRVLEQFAMHEKNCYFMIATTVNKVCIIERPDEQMPVINWESENCFYTLRASDMEVVGRLEGLAKGERIYAARFIGDYAFLVTYRRVDPLYCIDISDPTNPKAIGYLKELGYSEYLHPYGDHYLIGVGVSIDDVGRTTGLKVSLYDFSDPTKITKISEIKLDYQYSEVLWSYHAFTLNPVKSYMMFPIWDGIAVVSINGTTLNLKGIVDVDYARRSIYIDDYIYAIGSSIVVVDDTALETIAQLTLSNGSALEAPR
ncbi:MAG: beta-propeller domain-containing protein [Candidatus Nezhaarchaeales archaeon]